MPLETGDFIGELDAANPPGADPKSQGDDHIRLLKHTILGTFGPMVGLWALPTNDTWISQRNFADSAQVNMIKVNASDEIEFGAVNLVMQPVTKLIFDGIGGTTSLAESGAGQFDEIVGGAITRRVVPTFSRFYGWIEPAGHNSLDIGVDAKRWKDLFLSGNANVTGNIVVAGDLSIADNKKIFMDGGSANAGTSFINYLDSISAWNVTTRGTQTLAISNSLTRVLSGNLEVSAGNLTVSGGIHSGGVPTVGRIQLTDQAVVMGMQVNAGVASFQSNTNTSVQLAVGGVAGVLVDTAQNVSIPNGNLTAVAGQIFGSGASNSVLLPEFSFSGDVDTGMYRGGANNLRWGTGGVKRLEVDSTGFFVSTPLNATGAIQSDGDITAFA